MVASKKQRVLSPAHPGHILHGVQAMVVQVDAAAVPAKSPPVWKDVERGLGVSDAEHRKRVSNAKRCFQRSVDRFNGVPPKPRGQRKPKQPMDAIVVDDEVSV